MPDDNIRLREMLTECREENTLLARTVGLMLRRYLASDEDLSAWICERYGIPPELLAKCKEAGK